MIRLSKSLFAILVLTSTLLITNCSTKQDTTEAYVPLEISVALQKTMCFGSCPSYSFEVLNDGQAFLKVGRHTEEVLGRFLKEGDYTGQIDLSEIQKVIKFAENKEYSKLNARYDEPLIMDLPAVISTINGHTVFNRYSGPDLTDLYTLIERLMGSVDWAPKTDTER